MTAIVRSLRARPVVFTGPTIGAREAEALCPGAAILPPAEQGAVYHAVESLKAPAILMIDGVFGHVPAVRASEILWALHRGVRVLGAASLGALRAAELYPFGMAGEGTVFRFFRGGRSLDDSAVAVAVAPPALGGHALSVARVDVSASLRAAARHGVIAALGPGGVAALRALSDAIDYRERSYGRLMTDIRAAGLLTPGSADALAHFLRERPVRVKHADARRALLRFAAQGDVRRGPERPFTVTQAFLRDLDRAGLDTGPVRAVVEGLR